MHDDDVNPYAPPETIAPSEEKLIHPGVVRPSRSISLLVLISIATIAYSAFTVILILSNGTDRDAGMLFVPNVLVMLFWLVVAVRGSRRVVVAGVAAVVGQTLITIVMLVKGIGDFGTVLLINGAIVMGLLVLTAVCRGLSNPKPTA